MSAFHKSAAFLFVISALMLAGCGGEDENKSFTYELEYNGCNTGSHTFGSKEEYCSALTDYRLNNNGCAHSLREDSFKSNGCAGTFQETNR